MTGKGGCSMETLTERLNTWEDDDCCCLCCEENSCESYCDFPEDEAAEARVPVNLSGERMAHKTSYGTA